MANEELAERVKRYRKLTEQALKKVSVKGGLSGKEQRIVNDFLDMAHNYLSDGKHFEGEGKLELALAAYSYAHAWLDAGVRAGFLDGKQDDRLFALP
ncbi:MAG: DUF357 domain-containing protein [Candidatus Diapherotrites archaeon]|uniref:DUF357 domain-containing protein n=1 Tax=Candidatus Iainarchaeum sp. TaxID=3101447 RepID=A0A938YNJ0_9ARCH|nr:DUF357 domain-containing protein [Candidatus Diapherotrites archaeon]